MKQINAVQDASAKKRPPQQMQDAEPTKKGPPQHIFGLGLRKSPPEVNVADVITKSPTNSVAAAASTLIYQKNYVDGNSGGKGGRTELYDSEDLDENEGNASGSKEDDSSFHLDENENDAASGVEDDLVVHEGLEGLVYSDDEAYLFEVESEDEFRTSFPKDIARKNKIPGGPPKPDVRGMYKPKAEITLMAYAKERKAYNDKQRCARVKAVQSVSHLSGYSGHNSTQLRTMKDVESNRLEEDHTFASKNILNLRIAEEANLRCIKMKVERSDSSNFILVGIQFYVSGSFSESGGWKANTVVCRAGDDLLKIPPNEWIDNIDEDASPLRTPFKSKWLTT